MKIDIRTKLTDYYQGGRLEMLEFIPSTAKIILEVGCGNGNFGLALKQKLGAEVWGIEYESDHAAMAGTKLDKIMSGDVMILVDTLPDNHFDVIVFNDVLEHLLDPYLLLEKMKAKLVKDGVVVSSIPNIRYFRNFFDLIFRKNWDYADHGVMDFTHVRFFTINSIRKMYEELDYRILRMHGINATKSIKPWPMIVLSLGLFSDIKYLQFVTVARPNR